MVKAPNHGFRLKKKGDGVSRKVEKTAQNDNCRMRNQRPLREGTGEEETPGVIAWAAAQCVGREPLRALCYQWSLWRQRHPSAAAMQCELRNGSARPAWVSVQQHARQGCPWSNMPGQWVPGAAHPARASVDKHDRPGRP